MNENFLVVGMCLKIKVLKARSEKNKLWYSILNSRTRQRNKHFNLKQVCKYLKQILFIERRAGDYKIKHFNFFVFSLLKFSKS